MFFFLSSAVSQTICGFRFVLKDVFEGRHKFLKIGRDFKVLFLELKGCCFGSNNDGIITILNGPPGSSG